MAYKVESTTTSAIGEATFATVAIAGKSTRIVALDFTKGTLVLIMVLYHWLNYFVGPTGFVYRYLRFLPPSFIFITGFLISHVYLARPRMTGPHRAIRLTIRGVKILAIFISLNLTSIILPVTGFRSARPTSLRALMSIFTLGTFGAGKAAAFSVLVPIGYLLIISACLMSARSIYKHTFPVISTVVVLGTTILDAKGVRSANLQLVAIGLLGVMCGYIGIHKVNNLARFRYILLTAYVCYLAIITIWEVDYPLQIVGVCLTVTLIYMVGLLSRDFEKLERSIVLLGRYSLFAYVAQIAIVQLLYRAMRPLPLGPGLLSLAFFLACALTMISVEVVDRARAHARTADRLYKAILA